MLGIKPLQERNRYGSCGGYSTLRYCVILAEEDPQGKRRISKGISNGESKEFLTNIQRSSRILPKVLHILPSISKDLEEEDDLDG